jgi:hypothetical protein
MRASRYPHSGRTTRTRSSPPVTGRRQADPGGDRALRGWHSSEPILAAGSALCRRSRRHVRRGSRAEGPRYRRAGDGRLRRIADGERHARGPPPGRRCVRTTGATTSLSSSSRTARWTALPKPPPSRSPARSARPGTACCRSRGGGSLRIGTRDWCLTVISTRAGCRMSCGTELPNASAFR